MEPFEYTLSEASRLIHNGELSPTELAESLFQRIDELEPKLKAWVTINKEGVMATADQYSKEAEKKNFRGPLHGIPVGVKDIFFTAGLRTTAGSKILADFVPSFDSTAVANLKVAGAIILGKTETTEFAYLDPAPTRNPWNLEHTPGGSSSGSAAAVSSGMCAAALGSQTGGSVIRPAAYCGIVGLKPTYGRISRHGVVPCSWSLDHVGVLARTVEDAAMLLEILAGHDLNDTSSSTLPVPSYSKSLAKVSPPRLVRLGEFFQDKAEEAVRNCTEQAVRKLGESGAEVIRRQLPGSFTSVLAAHRIMLTVEAAAFHQKNFHTRMMDYRPLLRSTIAAGLLTPASTYLRAKRIKSRFTREVLALLQGSDCLLTPATTTPAPRGLESTGDPAFNLPWSFCGFPSITVPSGLTERGLPLGIQLVARPFDEETLLSVARWCEKVLCFRHEPHNPRLPTNGPG
ncbi:MAG: amidase [archaeon]